MGSMNHTKTLFMLMAQFDGAPAVPLSECFTYLGYASNTMAQRDALEGHLAVPTFRAKDSQKAPRMVMLEDLASHIDACAEQGRKEHKMMYAG